MTKKRFSVKPTFMLLALATTSYANVASAGEFLNPHRVNLTGVAEVGYPQLCIRTNRAPERLPLIEMAKKVVAEHPDASPAELIRLLIDWADSGQMGHAWLDYFYKDANGQIKTDAYGFGSNNNGPERKFSYQKCVSVAGDREEFKAKAEELVTKLGEESKEISHAFGDSGYTWGQGKYSLYGNCSWFAGEIFNTLVPANEAIDYAQPFDWSGIAQMYDIPSLTNVHGLPDPGYIAESISKTINALGANLNHGTGLATLTGDHAVKLLLKGGYSHSFKPSTFYPGVNKYIDFVSAGSFTESQNKMHFFTRNLTQNVEISVTRFGSDFAIKNIDRNDIIAAFPKPYDDTTTMVITTDGDIIDSSTWEKTDSVALKKYAGQITAASNYQGGGNIYVILRGNNEQTDPSKSLGATFIKYNAEYDSVLSEPKPIEELPGYEFFKLN